MVSAEGVVVVGAMADCTAKVTEDSMDEFEQFWAAYPRKTGKGVARKAFAKALRLTTLDTMLTALQWQRQQEQWVKQGGQFIPHPSTWLNQERWDDQPTQVPTLTEKTTRTFLAIYGGNDVQ